ncbi:MAG: hypothetical protein WBG86_04135, partial [Polyangiales bacterium]
MTRPCGGRLGLHGLAGALRASANASLASELATNPSWLLADGLALAMPPHDRIEPALLNPPPRGTRRVDWRLRDARR